MLRFIIRRLAFVVVVLTLSSAIIFACTQVVPGDVATMILGRYATEPAKERLRDELGLNKPVVVQYGEWLSSFVKGDWGNALSAGGEPVRPLVFGRLVNSMMLAAVAFLIYVPLGILLGLIAALRRNRWQDQAISVGALSFVGLPEFVTGLLLISIFAIRLGWFPPQSAIAPGTDFISALPYLILPAVTVSLANLAYVLRMTRSSTVDVLQADYVRTANLKGLAPKSVLFTHVLRNALLPTVTIVAMGIGFMIGGLIVTESVFGYPGLGRLVLYAVQRRDVPLVQAAALVGMAVYCISTALADIIYACLNPRIRYS